MYTIHKNAQIIIALLKEYGIRNIVISAGTRHIPIVFSVEEDNFFNCYSIVDERSAAFFALGLIQETQQPACIICTSGTATCNYVSAVNEAYYQHLPLVVLTSDRNRAYLNQLEGQCLPQLNLFKDVIRKVVDLPIVRDELDAWYCSRLVNEALLELDHREKGPVQINFQIDDNYPEKYGTFRFEVDTLPNVKRIHRLMAYDADIKWQEWSQLLVGKRIMISWGENLPISDTDADIVQKFCQEYNAVIRANNISNIHTDNTLNNSELESAMNIVDWNNMRPDIVITMFGNEPTVSKQRMKQWGDKTEHWHISSDGLVADPYKRLSRIIECPPIYFFSRMLSFSHEKCNGYSEQWKALERQKVTKNILDVELEYSAIYAVQGLIKRIPQNALLHIANSNTIRNIELLPLPKDVVTYCNRGTCGIDGSMSSYIAQSYVTNRPSFLVIGDLSFFYDMNALWNKYHTKNTRILLSNNSGGALFHSQYYKSVKVFDNIDRHIAAEHDTTAKGWAESQGFEYLCARTKEEYDANICHFTACDNTRPILFEIFTDKEIDQTEKTKLNLCCKSEKGKGLHTLKEMLPEPIKNVIVSLIKK